MGTQAGFVFATGYGYIQFDTVLEVIRSYKEGFEKEVALHVPQEDVAPKVSLAAELFGAVEVAEPHFCNPYEPEIALLTEAMELVERARELTIKAITNDVTGMP